MDILLQIIISEFSIKDPKNLLRLDLTTIEGVAANFATRRFWWPVATLLLATAEGRGTLCVPRLLWTKLRGPLAPSMTS